MNVSSYLCLYLSVNGNSKASPSLLLSVIPIYYYSFNLKCACFTVVLLIEWPKMQDYLIVLDYICDFISVNEQELKSKHRCFCGMVIKFAPKNAFLQAILLMF